MATKTKSDLIIQAFDVLGPGASGQVLSDEDFVKLDGLVIPVLETLSAERVVTIPDSDEIPAEIFLPVAALLAEAAASSYGRPANEQTIMMEKMKIRTILRASPTYEVMTSDFF